MKKQDILWPHDGALLNIEKIAGCEFALSLRPSIREPDSGLLLEWATSPFAKIPHMSKLNENAPLAARIAWAESRRAVLAAHRVLATSQPCFVSLSHTKLHSGAAAVVAHAEIRGIGFDLEERDRVVAPGALEKFSSSAELARSGLSALEMWCVKEACFKADPQNHGAYLSMYEVLPQDPTRISRRGSALRFDFKVITLDATLAAVALARSL